MLESPKALSTHEVKNEEMPTMDNQQETLNAWLAGIIDGEGSIYVHVNQYKRPSRGNPRPQLMPRMSVGSTSQEIIEKAKLTINQYTGCLIQDRVLPSGKLFQTIHVVGAKRTKAILEPLLPHLTLKRKNAELTLEFINSRLSKERNVTYNDREWEITKLTKSGSSETTREAPALAG